MRACTPGLTHRWSWYIFPDYPEGGGEPTRRPPPEEGDIAVHERTGSCYLVLGCKRSSRKAAGWYTLHLEGLGAGAAELGDEGTFGYANLDHEAHEAIRAVEQAERIERGEVVHRDGEWVAA